MFHNYNQSEYYLARIDALLNHIYILESYIEHKTDTNIADSGTKIAEYKLLVKYGIKIAIAITGVKFGGCGIILLKAIKPMKYTNNTIFCFVFFITVTLCHC